MREDDGTAMPSSAEDRLSSIRYMTRKIGLAALESVMVPAKRQIPFLNGGVSRGKSALKAPPVPGTEASVEARSMKRPFESSPTT